MNRISPGLNIGEAVGGFLQAKAAESLSPRTVEGYRHDLAQWLLYAGDGPVIAVTTQDVRAYLAYLRTDYIPKRLTRKTQPLSPKTIRNIYITLSSFFTWLRREFDIPSPMRPIPAPAFQEAEVEPFTQQEVEALLKAAQYSKEANTRDRLRFVMRRPTGLRDRALILVLLDTGLRASELCALNVGDVDEKTGKIIVKHGREGGAKGSKGRFVYLGKAARRTLWRYLVTRQDDREPTAPLFTARYRRMQRDTLRQVLGGLGEKAQVNRCHPHKFRHTFAITYLRSGGDVFTLVANQHSDRVSVLPLGSGAEEISVPVGQATVIQPACVQFVDKSD
jgi:integrase/recombinase XerD